MATTGSVFKVKVQDTPAAEAVKCRKNQSQEASPTTDYPAQRHWPTILQVCGDLLAPCGLCSGSPSPRILYHFLVLNLTPPGP